MGAWSHPRATPKGVAEGLGWDVISVKKGSRNEEERGTGISAG